MDTVFPFGLPAATSSYLILYLLTLVVHAVFMSYVLAGSAYLAAHLVLKGPANDNALTLKLRDWLPFMLSAAITAGIAPLLFIQILYKEAFYSANLLQFHRWMAILPVLIVGFYLLYVLKSHTLLKKSRMGRAVVGIIGFLCFLFVAVSWTENHLLSLQPVSVWADQYASRSLIYHNPHAMPRLAVWIGGTFATMPLLLAWQLWYGARTSTGQPLEGAHRTATVALSGLTIGFIAAVIYLRTLETDVLDLILGQFAMPYLGAAAVGWSVQTIGWVLVFHRGFWSRKSLMCISAGSALMLIGGAVVRETIRLGQYDLASLAQVHEQAARWSGFALFVAFLVLNSIVLTICVLRVRSGLSEQETSPTE